MYKCTFQRSVKTEQPHFNVHLKDIPHNYCYYKSHALVRTVQVAHTSLKLQNKHVSVCSCYYSCTRVVIYFKTLENFNMHSCKKKKSVICMLFVFDHIHSILVHQNTCFLHCYWITPAFYFWLVNFSQVQQLCNLRHICIQLAGSRNNIYGLIWCKWNKAHTQNQKTWALLHPQITQ